MEIVWTDAAANTGDEGSLADPQSETRFGGLVTCHDVGFLISKNRKEVKLAVSVFPEDDSYRHSITIPRGWVQEILVLQRPSSQLHHPEDLPPNSNTPDNPPEGGSRAE